MGDKTHPRVGTSWNIMIEKLAMIIQSNPTQHENIEHIIGDEYSKQSNIISRILEIGMCMWSLGSKSCLIV